MLPNIFYLDDEADLLEMFMDMFESESYKISLFSDSAKFLEALKHTTPDLVFIDYRLPGCTGEEIALNMDPRIPKVLVTGEIEITPRAEFILIATKPYDPALIESIIAKYVKGIAVP